MKNSLTMRPSQLASLLEVAILNRMPVLIIGPIGIGKTSVPRQVAKKLGYHNLTDHPVYGDPTDARGIPWFDQKKGEARFYPIGNLAQALNATEPTLYNIDDFGQASPAVQAAYAPILLDREVDGRPLPDHVSVVATSNRRVDRSGVTGLLEMVKGRLTIVELETHIDDVTNWMLDNNAPFELIAFLRFREILLHGSTVFCDNCKMYVVSNGRCLNQGCGKSLPAVPTQDLVNSPNPRNWFEAAKWINKGLPPDVELAAISGRVGPGAAAEFVGALRVMQDMPPLDGILIDPEGSKIPHDNPAAMYTVCTGLAEKATVANFARVLRYAERMHEHKCKEHPAGLSQFTALLLRDVYKRKPETCDCSAWIKMMAGPIGRLIRG